MLPFLDGYIAKNWSGLQDGEFIAGKTGIAVFDNQIEIESIHATRPFCLGGDSGSVILDSERRATALLFAGSEEGGAGDLGLTFANPIAAVMKALGISFPA